MRLKDLFLILQNIGKDNNISPIFLCGGVPRDKIMGTLKNNLVDLDITTGDSTIHNLAKETALFLAKNYNIVFKKMDDGHHSIFLGNIKLDFSSNFNNPNITELLIKKGIKNPTSMQKEIYSRDFRCNALLLDLNLKDIIDPTNFGISDINNKILKTCLDPEITLSVNSNRIIRAIYLSAKLGFEIDDSIVNFIIKNKHLIKNSSNSYISATINKALDFDSDRTVFLLNKMNLWDSIPIDEKLAPFFKKSIKISQKNYDLGEGIYSNLDKYKSVSDFRKKRLKKRKKDIENIINSKNKFKK